jgi:hypothetical protein
MMKKEKAQQEGMRNENDTGDNNLESSFSTLTVKIISIKHQTKYLR